MMREGQIGSSSSAVVEGPGELWRCQDTQSCSHRNEVSNEFVVKINTTQKSVHVPPSGSSGPTLSVCIVHSEITKGRGNIELTDLMTL